MMNKEKKKIYVKEMKNFFSKSSSVFVTHYQGLTVKQIDELKNEYKENTGSWPTIIYVGDNEELQSYMLWFAPYYGLKSARTEGDTFVCGHLSN